MNTQAEIALADFKKDYEAFLLSCNELEESGRWDVDELGPAAAYFEADVFAATMQVMSADGVFELPEAEVVNAMFDTQYSPRQLSNMQRSLSPALKAYLSEDSDDALTLLKGIDSDLAETYRKLLLEACRIVSLSDGVAEKNERMLIAQLREMLA